MVNAYFAKCALRGCKYIKTRRCYQCTTITKDRLHEGFGGDALRERPQYPLEQGRTSIRGKPVCASGGA